LPADLTATGSAPVPFEQRERQSAAGSSPQDGARGSANNGAPDDSGDQTPDRDLTIVVVVRSRRRSDGVYRQGFQNCTRCLDALRYRGRGFYSRRRFTGAHPEALSQGTRRVRLCHTTVC